ncbi:MAG: hypothetical protein L0K80_10825, partial [Lacticaseibacillus paracasei]|nr:hypothetical protein [Lacticaseibacillus paracasei]
MPAAGIIVSYASVPAPFLSPFCPPLAGKYRSIQKQVIKSCFNGFAVADNLAHKNKPPAIAGRRLINNSLFTRVTHCVP